MSPERDIWSLCVFACWWLWGVAVVGSSSLPASASFCAGTTWGTKKSTKIDKIHKIHAPKFQDVFFLRVPNRRRQATTSRTARGNYHLGGELPPRGGIQTLNLEKCMIYSRKIDIFKCQYAHFAHIHLSFGCTDEKIDLSVYLDTYKSKCQNFQTFQFEN